MLKYLFTIVLAMATIVSIAKGEFSIDDYNQFLIENQDMSLEKMYQMYPSEVFKKELSIIDETAFLDSVRIKYELTDDELRLLDKHGFVVSERLSENGIWDILENVYNNDLPVFITTDMILHALHMSYRSQLMYSEAHSRDILAEAFNILHNELAQLKANSVSSLDQNFDDVDVYITVARCLLDGKTYDSKFNNDNEVKTILEMIEAQQVANYKLFTSTPKTIDFSQFTPRGHYTQQKELTSYFKAMMWLGRIQFYLTKPESDDVAQTDEDIQRQVIDAAILKDLALNSDAHKLINAVDDIIVAFVGESDNVKLEHIDELMTEAGINSIPELLNMDNIKAFQEALENKPYAGQKILSQILMSDPMSPDQIKPSSSFLMMGQRFTIDSYVTGNVVYDKIMHKGKKVLRLKPSAFDVLFALGNDEAGDLLKPELEKYPYMSNLSSLRYLVDGYNNDFWESSFYNGWLNSIKQLNAPDEAERGKLPEFMKTAAWWQSRMNTQLAGWAQLRHDNLLYVKQSYTGGVGCFYPTAYLEPEPDFYREIADLAKRSKETFLDAFEKAEKITNKSYYSEYYRRYYDTLNTISLKLEEIAKAELAGNVSAEQIEFLKQAYSMANNGCVEAPDGWYADLFIDGPDEAEKPDYVVVDIHTTPTDESGAPVGWVWHVGTGNVDMIIVKAVDENGKPTVFCGPTMSFHEMTSLNFKRYTDEEWKAYFMDNQEFNIDVTRPDFTNLYLADKDGNNQYLNPPILPTSVKSVETEPENIEFRTFAQPNPFVESVVIGFKIDQNMIGSRVKVSIYDQTGRKITQLFDNVLGSGSYSVRWDGKDDSGIQLQNGVYLYQFEINDQTYSGKVMLNR